MKAIVYTQHGLPITDPRSLFEIELPKPQPVGHDILVKIRAISVTLSVGPDGYLYFTTNQLNRQPGFHSGKDLRQKPYALLRIKINAAPAPTH